MIPYFNHASNGDNPLDKNLNQLNSLIAKKQILLQQKIVSVVVVKIIARYALMNTVVAKGIIVMIGLNSLRLPNNN